MFTGITPPSLDIEDYKTTPKGKGQSDVKVLFPSLVFEQKIEGYAGLEDEIVGYCYGERGRDPEGSIQSNVNGWQSNSDYHLKESTLLDALSRGLGSIGGFREGYGLRLLSMWININPTGAFNNPHVHPGCDFGGVLWIKTSPECGKIEFENPHYFSHPNVHGYSNEMIEGAELFPAYDFVPRVGELLLFPSYLRHGVHVNRSEEDRISCSFNAVVEKV